MIRSVLDRNVIVQFYSLYKPRYILTNESFLLALIRLIFNKEM